MVYPYLRVKERKKNTKFKGKLFILKSSSAKLSQPETENAYDKNVFIYNNLFRAVDARLYRCNT